jgi:hypothetical protein
MRTLQQNVIAHTTKLKRTTTTQTQNCNNTIPHINDTKLLTMQSFQDCR